MFGLQTTNNKVLKNIGRNQTIEDFEIAYKNITDVGIKNVSLDVITGLPGDNLKNFNDTIDYIVGLGENIKHISIYSLEVHENTKIDFLIKNDFLQLPSEDEERKMKHLADKLLDKNGYKMYEISNYSKPGYESKHNNRYWLGSYYLGIGSSASSYILGTRYTNISNIDKYITNIENGIPTVIESDDLTDYDVLKEWVMLRFRLNTGVSKKEFKDKFKQNLDKLFKEELGELIDTKLIYLEDTDKYILTKKGRDLANLVFEKFI